MFFYSYQNPYVDICNTKVQTVGVSECVPFLLHHQLTRRATSKVGSVLEGSVREGVRVCPQPRHTLQTDGGQGRRMLTKPHNKDDTHVDTRTSHAANGGKLSTQLRFVCFFDQTFC